MTIEIGYVLPAGTWVAQDHYGKWFAYKSRPERATHACFDDNWLMQLGDDIAYLTKTESNPYWRETLHQIQPGEVIYLSD